MSTGVLEATNVSAGYNGQPVVRNLHLSVSAGEIVCLLGPNGAGKTTTLLALAGELALMTGEVKLHGHRCTGPLHARARAGLSFVSEDRSLFLGLSVRDNLRIGGCEPERVFGLFPELAPMASRIVGLLSGGQQQMLTVGRALARTPRILMVDELSLGLAPLVVERLLKEVARAAHEEGIAVLLVEQHVRQALAISDHALVMQRGRIVLDGTAHEVADRIGEVEASYLAQSSDAQ